MIKLTGQPKTSIQTLGLGVFDGLHLGHHELSKHCDYLLSFHPHPDIVLKKESDLKLITTKRELRLLYKNMIFLHFTKAISALTAEEFLDTLIKKQLTPQHIVVGYDFKFGFKKQGTTALLQEWGKKEGIKISVIDPFTLDSTPVKSGLIRTLIRQNQFEKAIRYLGHPFPIVGTVIKGDGRGKTLGFPTANLRIPPLKLLPTKGVYQCTIHFKEDIKPGLLYIGTKPTFHGETSTVEVHIPNLNRSLYNQQLTVFLHKKVRDEMHFSSSSELITQIKKDLLCLT